MSLNIGMLFDEDEKFNQGTPTPIAMESADHIYKSTGLRRSSLSSYLVKPTRKTSLKWSDGQLLSSCASGCRVEFDNGMLSNVGIQTSDETRAPNGRAAATHKM